MPEALPQLRRERDDQRSRNAANDATGRNPKREHYEHNRERAEFLPYRDLPWLHEDHAKAVGQEKWRSKARTIL